MYRLLFASSNIIFSVLLGAVVMTLFALNFDDAFKQVLNGAEQVKAWMIGLPMSTRYQNFIRLFLHESSFVFAFFTIVARIAVAFVASLVMWIVGKPDGPRRVEF